MPNEAQIKTGTVATAPVSTESSRATYSASVTGLVGAAAATDIFEIKGSATKTVRVNRLQISGIATAAAAADVVALLRSTANTVGTSTAPTAAPHDPNSAAATAALKAYTANPTTGTLVANIRAQKLPLGTSAAPGAYSVVWDFTTRNDQGVVLRGANQSLCINLAGQTFAGNAYDIDAEWVEDNS